MVSILQEQNDSLGASLSERELAAKVAETRNQDLSEKVTELAGKLATEQQHKRELTESDTAENAEIQRVQELEEKLASSERRNQDLEGQRKEDKRKWGKNQQGLLKQKRDLAREVKTLNESNQVLRDKNEELQHEVAGWSGERQLLQEKNAALACKLENCNREYDSLDNNWRKFIEDTEQIRKKFDANVHKELTSQIAAQTAQIETLEYSLTEVIRDFNEKDRENEFLIEGCKRLEGTRLKDVGKFGLHFWSIGVTRIRKIKDLQEQLTALKNELSASLAREEEHKSKIMNSRKREKELGADNTALRSDNSDLKDNLRQLKTQLQRLRKPDAGNFAAEAVAFGAAVAEKLSSVLKQLAASKVEIHSLKQKLVVHDMEKHSREAEVVRLRTCMQEMNKILRLREDELQTAKSAINAFKLQLRDTHMNSRVKFATFDGHHCAVEEAKSLSSKVIGLNMQLTKYETILGDLGA
ncbi:hypothetical protein BU26DRAFT_186754 [Trematosphaeria pertusa]|uniref:Uncharacterized protein n=1 Tax=Trematosphaeria pertusa TaxID=390896 RepID=A0A6A6HSG4_9PLEO|nr:uncharacterized protein BU26DRAFT_186754 [Trematosphaeria pertusa]KAF2241056.1 hypothetical protein BU26DRAFT_186754 [Trematosphaeria pertusa]